MAPTRPSAQAQPASTAGPSLAAGHGVQPASAKSALEILDIARSSHRASVSNMGSTLHTLIALGTQIRDLEASHAKALKDRDDWIIKLSAEQHRPGNGESTPRRAQRGLQEERARFETEDRGTEWSNWLLLQSNVDLKRELKEEKAKNVASESAKEKLKKLMSSWK